MKLETLCCIVFLILLTLKLLDQIDWSWWWVTAPLWGMFVVGFLILLIFGFLDHKYGKHWR